MTNVTFSDFNRPQLIAELKVYISEGYDVQTKLSGKGITNEVLRAELDRLYALSVADVDALEAAADELEAAAITIDVAAVPSGSVQNIAATFGELRSLLITLICLVCVALPKELVHKALFTAQGWLWPIRFITAIAWKHPVTVWARAEVVAFWAQLVWIRQNWATIMDAIFCLEAEVLFLPQSFDI